MSSGLTRLLTIVSILLSAELYPLRDRASASRPQLNASFKTLTLSPTSKIQWSSQIPLEMRFLPSLQGYLFTDRQDANSFSLWVSRAPGGKRPVNDIFVKMEWANVLRVARSQTDSIVTDRGCAGVGTNTFHCTFWKETAGPQHPVFVIQSIDWNDRLDVISMRAQSPKSLAHAQSILAHVQTLFMKAKGTAR